MTMGMGNIFVLIGRKARGFWPRIGLRPPNVSATSSLLKLAPGGRPAATALLEPGLQSQRHGRTTSELENHQAQICDPCDAIAVRGGALPGCFLSVPEGDPKVQVGWRPAPHRARGPRSGSRPCDQPASQPVPPGPSLLTPPASCRLSLPCGHPPAPFKTRPRAVTSSQRSHPSSRHW